MNPEEMLPPGFVMDLGPELPPGFVLDERPEARQDDPNSPIQRAMKPGGIVVSDDPSRSAGAGTQAIGSLPTEIKARVEFYAGRRFPETSLDEAVDRYGIRDGRLFYLDDGGKAFFEESSARLPESISDIPAAAQSTGKAVAGSAGPALPVITGTASGIATFPVAGGIPGAAAGGAAGDVSRQFLSSALTGEEKTFSDRALQTGGAALQEGAGQALGVVGGRALKGLGRTPTFDIPQTTALGSKAERAGIELTPGELTGSKTLIRRQKILGNTTQGEAAFEEFYRKRNDQVASAVYDVLKTLSPESSVRGASAAGVEGAQAAVGLERAALQKQAGPLYEKAYTVDSVDTKPVLDLIEKKLDFVSSPVAAKLRALQGDLLKDGIPESRITKIDEVKKWLDDEINSIGAPNQSSSIGKAQKHHLNEIRQLLLKQADEADKPVTGGAYKQARSIYEEGLPAVGEIEKGLVGDVARLKANKTLQAAKKVFSPTISSPEDVALAREAFERAGKVPEWNALVRAHLQNTFESIPESAFGNVTNLGGTFFKAVMGSPKKAAMISEGIKSSGGSGQDLLYLFEVLKATGAAAKGESITAFAQAGQRELARESKPFLSSAVETVEFWKTPSRIAQLWADIAEGRYAGRMADMLTSPEGMAKLKELRGLSPTSAGAIIGFTHLLTGGGVASASQPSDFDPAANQ